MRKYSCFVLFVLIFTLYLSGCGEKANRINLPPIDNISSIEIAGGFKDTIITDKEIIAAFIQKAVEAIPTSKQSVQDVPTVAEYTRIDFVSSGNISSIFIYQENSKWYIEQPYHGIYETDETLLKLLKNNLIGTLP